MLSTVSTSIGNKKKNTSSPIGPVEVLVVSVSLTWSYIFEELHVSADCGCTAFWVSLGRVLCMSVICFLFASVSVSAHRHPRVWKSGVPYVISFCQQDWLGEPCPGGWIWDEEKKLLWYLSKPISVLSCPSIPLSCFLAFFFFHFSFLLSHDLRESSRGAVFQMGWFPPSSSLVALSLSRINIEKTPNLTAEWLIQIIVAFSCIRLLFSLTLFLLFFLSLCTVWYLGHLWIRAFERKGRKNEWHQRGGRKRGIQNLSSPVIFCSASMIACMTIIDK